MKRYISTLALCALAFIGLNSCNKAQEVDLENGTRTVTFQVQMGPDTRTGLSVKFVPDWTDTKIANVHLFEDHKGNHMEGKNVKMEIDENNDEIAYFSADYTDEWTIIVDPTMPETRASATDYVYTGVVAQRTGEGDNAKYVVPAVQNPGKNTLIDPDADFLVGRAPEAYTSGQSLKQVDMIFKRPVSVSRLAIWGIPEGEKVQEVKIVSADKLTGSVALSGIDFENRTVAAFDETSGSTTITLNYGAGEAVPAEAFFNAYFISLPGAKKILSIEVTTDQKTYVKEFEGGKTLTFKTPDFKSIAVNMLDTATDDGKQERDLHFVKGQTTVTTDAYDIWDTTNQTYSGDYVAPTLAGTTEGATPVWNSSEPDVATVDAEGNVTIVGAGTTDITVFVASSDTYKSGNAAFTLTVSDSTPAAQNQPLKFVKGGADITIDNTDIYPEVSYTTPTLQGAVSGATVTYSITCIPEGCATLTQADGQCTVTPVAAGEAVITATATAVAPLWKATETSYQLNILDSTPEPSQTVTIKLEPATELVAGNQYYLVSNGKVLVRNGEAVAAADFDATAVSVTLANELAENAAWTLGTNTDSNNRGNIYDFANGGYYFGAAMNTQPSTYTYEIGLSKNKTISQYISIQNNNIDLTTGYVYYKGNSSSQYIYYDAESNEWSLNKQSNGTFPAACKTNLYVVLDERAEQNLQFSAAAAEYDLHSKDWTVAVPTLSGAQTTVTYASSKEAVATVDNDGKVTIASTAKKGDTATITATAAATDAYKEGSASYTITIVDNNPDIPTFTKVTSNADVEDDAQYILVYESSSKAFKPILNGSIFTKSTANAVDVEIVNNTISSSDLNDCLITFEDGKYLWIESASKYLYSGESGDNVLGAEDKNASHTVSITIDNNGIATVAHSDDAKYHLYWSSSDYFSGISSTDSKYAANICVYKLEDGRQARSMEFNAATAEIDLANTSAFVKPTLTVGGDETTVKYTSSDTSIAEVSNDGTITAKKKGEVTITAKAARTATYKAASASYKLTVVNSDVKANEYTKVMSTSDLVAGAQYLIVYENGASSKVFKAIISGSTVTEGATNAISATVSNATIVGDDDIDACQVVLEAASDGYYYLKAGSAYVYPSNNALSAETTATRPLSVTVTNGKAVIKRSNYSHYLGYDSYFVRSGSETENLAIYKLDGGSSTTSTYTQISFATGISTGQYLIVNPADAKVFTAVTGNPNAADVTPASGVISGNYAAYEFTISASGSDITIQNASGQYLYYVYASGSTASRVAYQATANGTWTPVSVSSDANGFDLKWTSGSSTQHIYWSDTFFKIGSQTTGVHLYKKN